MSFADFLFCTLWKHLTYAKKLGTCFESFISLWLSQKHMRLNKLPGRESRVKDLNSVPMTAGPLLLSAMLSLLCPRSRCMKSRRKYYALEHHKSKLQRNSHRKRSNLKLTWNQLFPISPSFVTIMNIYYLASTVFPQDTRPFWHAEVYCFQTDWSKVTSTM